MARRPRQLRFNLGEAARKSGRVRSVGRRAKAQMTGRVPPLRGRGRSRASHPTGSTRSRATRAGDVLGRQAGHAAAGFASTAHKSYRATRPGPSVGRRVVTSKGARYAAAGAVGAVGAKAGYGLVKARVGRSNQSTHVVIAVPAQEQQRRRRRGLLGRRGPRRDRYGRFR